MNSFKSLQVNVVCLLQLQQLNENNLPQWRVGWGNQGEGGAGSQGHCSKSNAPHFTAGIIIIIINMGSNFTCTINCNYRSATKLSTQETWIVSGTQLKILCIKEINNNNSNNNDNIQSAAVLGKDHMSAK